MEPLMVRISGPLACFTRPENKVERVTYPIPTPSALRGILESIFWKPEFRWEVTEIQVLAPIRYMSLRRNEIHTRQSARMAQSWVKSGSAFFAEDHRAQRNTLALRDVDYLVKAQIRLNPHATDDPAKYRDQFRRRVHRGQCFQQPFLGIREFVAAISEPAGDEQPIAQFQNWGRMLFDLAFIPDPSGPIQFMVGTGHGTRGVRGYTRSWFFEAQMKGGIVSIPHHLYEEMAYATTALE